jgi:hypothetical protein
MDENASVDFKVRLMFAGPCDELSNGKKGYRKYLEKTGKLESREHTSSCSRNPAIQIKK